MMGLTKSSEGEGDEWWESGSSLEIGEVKDKEGPAEAVVRKCGEVKDKEGPAEAVMRKCGEVKDKEGPAEAVVKNYVSFCSFFTLVMHPSASLNTFSLDSIMACKTASRPASSSSYC